MNVPYTAQLRQRLSALYGVRPLLPMLTLGGYLEL